MRVELEPVFWKRKKKEQPRDELVTIANLVNVGEAGVFKARLESYGIQCFVFDNLARTMYLPTMLGDGVKVQIRKSDLEKARDILSEP